MPVSNTSTFTQSTANGVTTVFPYDFTLLDEGDLVVKVDGAVVSSGFSVDGIGVAGGGNITFDEAPDDQAVVLRYRDIPLERSTDYQYQGPLDEEVLDEDFDRIWLAMQQLRTMIGLGPTLPIGAYPGVSLELPAPVPDGYFKWNEDGTAIQYVLSLDSDITPVSPFSAELLLEEDAAAWRSGLDVPSNTEMAAAISAAISSAVATALDNYTRNVVYAVGKLYVSTTSTDNPNAILGFGTWVAVAGRALVGYDNAQTEFDTLLKTGGAKTHTLTEDEIAAHGHLERVGQGGGAGTDPTWNYTPDGNSTHTGTLKTADAGGGQPHNNLQPYLTVAIWRRTA